MTPNPKNAMTITRSTAIIILLSLALAIGAAYHYNRLRVVFLRDNSVAVVIDARKRAGSPYVPPVATPKPLPDWMRNSGSVLKAPTPAPAK